MIAVGLMSGTSLDGVDAALVQLHPRGEGYEIVLRRFTTLPFEPALLAELERALPPARGSIAEAAVLHHRLGEAFAGAALAVMQNDHVDYIASHGQTLWYDQERHLTLQLADPFVIREATRKTVCYDFRSADCAVGGNGAPLVPHVDALLFRSAVEDRVAVNIGGIANLTALEKGSNELVAFDTGPGNMLIDALVCDRTGGKERYDRDGVRASRGRVDGALLQEMLGDPYFLQSPPKATGRERFGAHFLLAHPAIASLETDDAVATLTELTAVSIADAIDALCLQRPRVIVSGGGAKNASLLSRLRGRLPGAIVERSEAMGISADAKEAIAFAVLGYETLRERAANVPSVTGARRAVPLGAIAPHGLRALLAAVEREC
jgi:anhydro-N-acetylmuramic acid kinase